MSREFIFSDPKLIHKQVYSQFVDQQINDFVDSRIYRELATTNFVRIDPNTNLVIQVDSCDVTNHKSPVFLNLRGDYDYLWRWYHNPHRKANTRHGNYMMLYLEEQGYVWRLNQAFVTKILSVPTSITDLFDFGT